MALSPTAGLSAATLAIYILLLPVILYILCKHGRHGLLGWLFVAIFALLQITASGIVLSHGGEPSMAGSILSTIGLSPILLGVQGVLHEVQLSFTPTRKLNHVLYFFQHTLILAGVVMTAIGASNALDPSKHVYMLQDPTPAEIAQDEQTTAKNVTLWKAGAGLLLLSWLIICASALATFFTAPSHRMLAADHGMRKLLRGVLFALPFVGIRTIVALVYAVTQNTTLVPMSGYIAVDVLLQFLPLLLAVLALVIVGWVSRNRQAKQKGQGSGDYNMSRC